MRNVQDEYSGLFFEHEGVRLSCSVAGGESKPAILFLHGWALDLRMWDPQAAALRSAYRIVRMDRRGFGASGGSGDPLTDARDAHALMDHLGIAHAFVVGMSQGARAALALATLAPARVWGLVLDGAPAVEGLSQDSWPDEVPVEQLLSAMRAAGIGAVRRDIAAHPFMQLRTGDRATHDLLARMIDDYRGEDLATRTRSTAQLALRLHRLQLPALALNGVHDTAQRRRSGDAYCGALPRCERALIPDAGHLPNLDNPDAYNAVLTGFFRRHAP